MIKGLVSVIIPVYNADKYMEKSIESVINQSYTNLEIILIDDGSVDQSGKICDALAQKDCRIKVVHQKNLGVSKARNVGLDIALGEYFTFIDSDDTVAANYIEVMVAEMELSRVDLVRLSWKRGTTNRTYNVHFDENGKYLVNQSNVKDLLLFANIWGLFKRESLKNLRFDEQLKYAEDNLFVFEFFLNSNSKTMLLMNKPYYYYTVVENSASQLDSVTQLNASKEFVKKILLLNYEGVNLEYLCDMYMYNNYLSLLYFFVNHGINEKDGFLLKDVKNEIKSLRRMGARESSLNSKLVSFLYRNNLHFVVKMCRMIKKI